MIGVSFVFYSVHVKGRRILYKKRVAGGCMDMDQGGDHEEFQMLWEGSPPSLSPVFMLARVEKRTTIQLPPERHTFPIPGGQSIRRNGTGPK